MKFYIKIGILLFIMLLYYGKSNATDFKDIKTHISLILAQQQFNDSIKSALAIIAESDSISLSNTQIFDNFNTFLFQLESKNFKNYHRDQYYDIILGFQQLLDVRSDKEIYTLVAQWLPEDYTTVKTLIPNNISNELLKNLGCEAPKEIIRQYATLTYIGDSSTIEVLEAIKQFPSYVKQFLHYNNNIKNICYSSKDSAITHITDIFKAYKFSSNAYFLLPFVIENKYTLSEAHIVGQENKNLLKLCTEFKIAKTNPCYTSTDEKYAELAERYLRKIRIQRQSSVVIWDLEELSTADIETQFYFLVFNQNSLDNKELSKYISWIKHKTSMPISEKLLIPQILSLSSILDKRLQSISCRDSIITLFESQAWDNFLHTAKIAQIPSASIEVPKIKIELPKPKLPKYIITPHKFNIHETEKEKIFLYNNPEWVLEHINSTGRKSFGKEILLNTAMLYPLEFLSKIDSFVLLPYGMDILKEISKAAPLTVKNYIINPNHKVYALMHYLNDSTVHQLFEIDAQAGNLTKAYLLIENIKHKDINIIQADTLTKSPEKYLPLLIQNLITPASLGKYSVEQELSAKALKFVRTYNISENTDMAEESSLDYLSAEQLYLYMILGEEEIIYSTFKKMFFAWQKAVPDKFQFLQDMNYYKWETFYRKCAFYDLESQLLQNISIENQNSLFTKLFPVFTYNLEPMIQTAEIIYYAHNQALLNFLEKKTKEGYELAEKNKDELTLAAYTILAGFLGKKMGDEYWSYYVSKQYALPEYSTISNFAIFNHNLTNIQQYYFYNDEDGISSYNNLLKTYLKSKSDWSIEDKGNYIVISSIYGKKIELYANKPQSGDKGIDDIEIFFRKENITPSIAVHRGLSTHTLKTFSRIPTSTMLILDGSCGGYHVQQVALSRAPTAQILCNRNVGTMYINDPIFKQLNEEIRLGNPIVWQDFWNKIKQKVGNNPYFQDYIPPDKNIYAQLTTAYFHLLDIR